MIASIPGLSADKAGPEIIFTFVGDAGSVITSNKQLL